MTEFDRTALSAIDPRRQRPGGSPPALGSSREPAKRPPKRTSTLDQSKRAGHWSLEGDLDALAGGPGYAIDAGLKLMKPINDERSVGASVRFLDGGPDNDEVYAFASFTSAGISIRWQPR